MMIEIILGILILEGILVCLTFGFHHTDEWRKSLREFLLINVACVLGVLMIIWVVDLFHHAIAWYQHPNP